jgi:cell division protein FtsB
MKMKLPEFKLPSRQKVTDTLSGLTEKGLVLVVIVYIAASVSRSVVKNYQMNKKLDALNKQLLNLQQEQTYLTTLIAYYKTDTFKELKAREELGYQKPGEHVLSVPVEESDKPLGTTKNSFIAQATPEEELPIPNYEKWYNYFFK